ncbi:MAG: extracellular solute-binding protein [Chelatococcus sp.]|uniref:ABC transporter substrate-binding protein n=1 Tax=Chelatococcus sp. TaxID=1953771 RepID=UPI0025C3D8A5|nr:extracellular solute-binding protein [Chelatococcus sp.]MBX3539565.1 extracellular solute-binding protein [Chelatococcus sp.]
MTDNRFSRRSVLRGAGAVAGAGAIGGFGMTSARAAKDLRVLMAGGTWGEWVNKTFADPFAKAKGIEFVWKHGIGQEPIVMAQRVRPQWDLSHSSQTKAGQLVAMGLYRPWTAERIPNIEKVHPSFRYEQLVGKCHTPYGLCVNTKRITRPVDSWLDMWDPAFKGKVAFPAWNWQGEEVFHAINIALGGSVENIEPGIAKFKTLFKDNQCKIINNVEHTKQLLTADEVWIAPYFGARTEQAAAAGAPVEFVIPKEGGLSWIWNMALVANRPKDSLELADAFMNTTLEAEAQIAFARLTGYPPTNMEAMRNLPPDLKKLELSEADVELLGKLQRNTDYMAMFAFRDQYVERWNKEVLQAA